MLFKRASFYLALAGLAAMVTLVVKSAHRPPAPPPLVEPARSPFKNSVAATGLIEARRENVKIAAPKGGLVQEVFVQVGSKVKQGDPLLLLDERESAARLRTMRAQVESMRATLATEEVAAADMTDQFERVSRLQKDRIASEDELKRKEFLLQATQARVTRLRADLAAGERQVEQAQVELAVLTVRAPRDGTILQVNLRAGEYAATGAVDPLMILGDVDQFQIRAEVDEQNAGLVLPGQPAVAFLKGSTDHSMPLQFVRIEPFVVPKKSLTGDSTERVDTRVLQVIFEFDPPPFPLYVGQQVDVFIDRPATANSAK